MNPLLATDAPTVPLSITPPSWVSGSNTVQLRPSATGSSRLSHYACDSFFAAFKDKHKVDLEPLILSIIKQHYPEMLV